MFTQQDVDGAQGIRTRLRSGLQMELRIWSNSRDPHCVPLLAEEPRQDQSRALGPFPAHVHWLASALAQAGVVMQTQAYPVSQGMPSQGPGPKARRDSAAAKEYWRCIQEACIQVPALPLVSPVNYVKSSSLALLPVNYK